jgi:hypothetical protein
VIDGVVSLSAVTIPMCMFGNLRYLASVRDGAAYGGCVRRHRR